MIAIVDYDAGNIASVNKALEFIGEKPLITRDTAQIEKADKIIVPGVGAFGDAMGRLEKYNLIETIRDFATTGRPILGICLGLQLFFEKSEEASEDVSGLSLLPGRIIRFPDSEGYKIPHMGWNSIEIRDDSRLFRGIPDNSYVYFVHSFYLQAKNNADVVAKSEYIVPFHATVEHENIFATQFHPEKSGDIGLQILKNFAEI